MQNQDLSKLDTQELKKEIDKLKSFSIMNAVLVGFLIGIIIYSVVMNTWGFLSIIPLYLIYKLVNDPRNKRLKEMEKILEERSKTNN